MSIFDRGTSCEAADHACFRLNSHTVGTLIGILTLALWAPGAANAEDAPPSRSMFAEFVGVCQASVDSTKPDLWQNITFIRTDLSWDKLQPQGRDDWSQDYLDGWGTQVLKNREHGVETLPVLGFMAPWAARRRPWSFVVGDTRYDVAAADGLAPRKVLAFDLKNGERKQQEFSPSRLPPEDVEDWENFVERVVAFLSKPPYNIKYFQPWNEADDPFTGFWYGGMDEYMKTIHLPAARAIRKHGGKVVYGGYPCSGSMQHLVQVCERNNAWDSIDVIDIHYFPLSSWEYLFQHVLEPKKVWGLWQTEAGFTTSTAWVPNSYPRFFHWAIRHGWQPDRYRLFQFAYWSPDSPDAYGYKCSFLQGNKLSHHGKALITMGRLLDSPAITPFADWRTEPVLRTELSENHSSVEGFSVAGRIVLAVHLTQEDLAALSADRGQTTDHTHPDLTSKTMLVRLPKRSPADIKAANRVGIYGSRLPLQIEPDGDGSRFTVPVADRDPVERTDNRTASTTTFYVVVE